MQSYPYQKDQVNYGSHYYPGTEAVPIPMYVNPVRPPINHQCWPWGGNYGYAPPVACHGCCNHSYLPSHYAWGSPYSHVPPVHYPGTYPPFPVQYVPPPCYAMEQPRYEYEKTVPMDHHYCRCPNHPSHQKEQKNVRIEEEEPDRERRKNDSLVPFQFKNRPFPIVWLPPDYSDNKEHGKVNNSEGLKDGSLDVQPHENGKTVDQQPAFWNGWYPLDLNNLVSSKPRGDGERNNSRQDVSKGSFPFPLLWIPYKAEQQEKEGNKVNDSNMKQSLESQKGSGGERNSITNGDKIGGRSSPRAKDIPVKEVEQHEDKDISKNKEKERDASVKGIIDNGVVKLDNGEKKDDKDGAKRKSPSPPRSSKLPPVCLRVDPLPRKKSANGSLRSPSPPGDKQNPDKPSNKTSKAHNLSENKEPDNILQKEFKEDEGRKTIEVFDGKTSQGKSMDANIETPIVFPLKSEDVSINKREEKPKEENISQEQAETDAAVIKGHTEDAESARGKSFRADEVGADEAKESSKTKLSEEEAAVIIQSAYRGFDIRRWEPIKKLKQIAKVQEQIAEVKHLTQALESSPDSQGNSKQNNIIAETIMSLLLKLDTVQGLHPSIREVRKSVVRELVSLQEKLDSLTNGKSENRSGKDSVTGCEGDALNKTDKVISSQNENENPSDLLEAQESQLDEGSEYENLQISEASPIGEQQCEKEKESAESGSELTIAGKDEKSNEVHENGVISIVEEAIENPQSSELPLLQNESSAAATDFVPVDDDKLETESTELPQGVSGKSTNHREIDAGTSNDSDAKQPAEGLVEEHIASESHENIAGQENEEHVEFHKVLGVPPTEVNVQSEAEETSPINDPLNKKFLSRSGTEEEVDDKNGDARCEADGGAARLPENVNAFMFGSSEASAERGLVIAESCNILDDNSESDAKTLLEEAIDTFPKEETSSQLPQEGNSEQDISTINESINTCEAADIITKAKEVDEDKSKVDKADSGECSTQQAESVVAGINDHGGNEGSLDAPPTTEVSSEQDRERITEHPEDAIDNEENTTTLDAKDMSISQIDPGLVQVSPANDELTESNRKLIEETERLRDMMQKLIRSGEEQLTAISSLSGRVKDLERRLSRKKKLKLKQHKAPRSLVPSDGSAKQRIIGVAM